MSAASQTIKPEERAQLAKHLPMLAGRVKAVLAKKDTMPEAELVQRTVQFGPVSFTYKDIVSFAEIFNLVDVDGSGEISAEEVKHLMNLLGDNVQLAEVEALIQEFDLDGSGEVDVTEFMYVLALQRRTEYTAAQVMRAFDLFGKNTQSRRGVIDKDLLREALVQYGGDAATPKEIHKLVESLPSADSHGSNEFDYLKHVSSLMS